VSLTFRPGKFQMTSTSLTYLVQQSPGVWLLTGRATVKGDPTTYDLVVGVTTGGAGTGGITFLLYPPGVSHRDNSNATYVADGTLSAGSLTSSP
jgi:hypothetical protein